MVLGPYEIQEAMEEALTELDRLVHETAEAAALKVGTERDFKVAFAQSRIDFRKETLGRTPKVTVDEINDHATVETADKEHAFNRASERLKYVAAARNAAATKLDALRSMGASIRASGG